MVAKGWTVETLNSTVDQEIGALPADMRTRLQRFRALIEGFGFDGVPPNSLRKLRGPLWEFRITGRNGISRALYVTAHDKRVVIVRVFVKKTQRTPTREIELALRRAREVSR